VVTGHEPQARSVRMLSCAGAHEDGSVFFELFLRAAAFGGRNMEIAIVGSRKLIR